MPDFVQITLLTKNLVIFMKTTTTIRLTGAAIGLAIPAQAAWSLIDNFEGLNAGDTITGTTGPGATWDGVSVYTAEADPDNAGNLAMEVGGGDGNQHLRAQFSSASSNIAAGATGTLYYRFRTAGSAGGTADSVVGLTDNPTVTNFNFKSGLRNIMGGGTQIDARNGGSYEALVTTLADNTWYSVWMVSTNTDPGTFELYLQSDSDANFAAQTKLATATPDDVFDYRINGATDIVNAYFRGASNGGGLVGDDFYYDDIWMDGSAANLTTPSAIPEPATSFLALAGLAFGMRRRRS